MEEAAQAITKGLKRATSPASTHPILGPPPKARRRSTLSGRRRIVRGSLGTGLWKGSSLDSRSATTCLRQGQHH
eukprot:130434-Pyramimonas_sp.AAC.1